MVFTESLIRQIDVRGRVGFTAGVREDFHRADNLRHPTTTFGAGVDGSGNLFAKVLQISAFLCLCWI